MIFHSSYPPLTKNTSSDSVKKTAYPNHISTTILTMKSKEKQAKKAAASSNAKIKATKKSGGG
eukprot:4174492-Prorocentrum_lima.AAC.1